MKTCDPSTCAYDQGGECARLCLQLHRPVLLDMPPGGKAEIVEGIVEGAPMPIDVVLPDDDALTAARYIYQTHRAQGRIKALRLALRSLFRLPVQPVNQ